MKFGEQLSSHLTPEWRKQYICYDDLKAILYDVQLEIPQEEELREQYITQMDENFFAQCDVELTKINLFFSQKIAEAQGKYHELQAELEQFKESIGTKDVKVHDGDSELQTGLTLKQKLKSKGLGKKAVKETAKSAQHLKLAFSEFYLSLILLQNYQEMNSTGFRKILKKHDKLMQNERGLEWRISKVEKSSFFLNRDIETLIHSVETSVINDLEQGNRQAGMKRLKVPPLSEKQSSGTTFSLGLFIGAFGVMMFAIAFSLYGLETRDNDPKYVAIRLYRGFFLFLLCVFFCGINMYGWSASGVNHVLIFEVDPRYHLTYQTVMQIAAFLFMVWGLSVLGFIYAHHIGLPPFLFPLLLGIFYIAILFNPFKKPIELSRRDSRFWLLKHCFNCFTAPFHFVTFTDFWLGDQMNSLSTSFLDWQYFICFYATEVDYTDFKFSVRTMNVTEGPIPWGYVDINTGKDMCTDSGWMRNFISIIPASVRFFQCLRRYYDSRLVFPHLVNAGKYSTTYVVVGAKILYKWSVDKYPEGNEFFFYLWVAAYVLSFSYTYIWDIMMDFGLFDPKAPKDAPFLREEIIYEKWFYYFAIVEDFVLRLTWVLNVSLSEAWSLSGDMTTCLTAPLEVFRRYIWNYIRLENEHINNVGMFRAVRDISIKPIQKGDLESLITKMDKVDGVTHRGQDLRNRQKKQKKANRDKRQLLKKAKIGKISLPTVIHCAKRGIKSDGVELNRVLVWYSRFNSLKNKTYPMTKFYRKDFFNVDLKKYDTTILFGAESTMEALLDKLNEMNKDSYLIACRFPLPKNGEEHWKIISENGEGIDTAWLYKKIA
ncbi:Xenotropic and polytropic retrovirus receptor 1 [Strongyloides ratti]|uniref:Xenotropic and polytropic retrovirus receptor 1 n=1 Tax=Strongyloides ratti TaxID=34506 RepID=A0A090LJ84_STRRB|nr:Xenotropic and polytropic retrovirus receptor 1 [Strongyloides ratti]CEF67600.1 Xenotropic and polytropic retrovirus receptor 1 [Strongyloides ratti]